MKTLINKNGLEVDPSPKVIFDELMRGTGFVMADRLSIFLEKESLTEKFIVVSKAPEGSLPAKRVRFHSGQFKNAWELFTEWMGRD